MPWHRQKECCNLRVDLHLHGDSSHDSRLERIEILLKTILQKEVQQMALGQEILDGVAANTTLIGSIKVLVQGFVDQGVITPAVGDAIKAALSGNRAELQAIEIALQSNVTPPTPTGFTLSVLADGGGSVSKSPDHAAYVAGSVVVLTATPDVGSSFQGWSGDFSDPVSPYNLTMDANKSVTATFVSL